MATVSAFSAGAALDMTKFNFFKGISKAVSDAIKKPSAHPAVLVDKSAITVFFNKTGDGEFDSAVLSSSRSNIQTEPFPLPGKNITLPVPKSGTIDSIALWHYDKIGKNTFEYKFLGSVYDVKLDVKTIAETILDEKYFLNPTKYAKSFEEAMKELYGDVFKNGDVLTGSRFGDKLTGYGGNDMFQGGKGKDFLYGDKGSDTASYSGAAGRVIVTIGDNEHNREYVKGNGGKKLQGDVLSSIENLFGSQFNDRLTGDGGKNVIGGLGGRDTLTGGKGSDTFVFATSVVAGSEDTITDFAAKTKVNGKSVIADKIQLDHFAFFAAGSVPSDAKDGSVWRLDSGKLEGNDFVASMDGSAKDEHSRILYNKSNGELKYDWDGTGSSEAVLFATLTDADGDHPQNLTAANFVIKVDFTPDF